MDISKLDEYQGLEAQMVRDATAAKARGKLCQVYFGRHARSTVTDEQVLACAAIMWPEEFGGKS